MNHMCRLLQLGSCLALLAACVTESPFWSLPAPRITAQSHHASEIADEVIVRLEPGSDPIEFARQHKLAIKLNIGRGMYVLKGSPAQNMRTVQDSRISWVEPNRRLVLPQTETRPVPVLPSLNRSDIPNDPLLPATYGFFVTGADKVWQRQPGRPEVVIAVIDSGIDASHPEFQGQLVPGWDLTRKPPEPGGNIDGYGHGTHVAGVIGAKANNGIGIAGIAPGCKLMPVRIFNEFGHSDTGYSTAAILWAVDHGAKVINASWGSPLIGQAEKDAYQYALDKDVLFVAAVGNSGNNDTENFPGASPGVIGVAATTDIDTWGSFSTWGDWVSLAAPGSNIVSTYPLKLNPAGYRIMDGTSMASPLVAAAAALVRSQFPTWNQNQVKQHLFATAKDVIMAGKDPYSGHGRVDIGNAFVGTKP